MPRHCLVPLLNGTTYFRSCADDGWSQRSGAKVWGEGKREGLSCMRTEVMPTGVYICCDSEPFFDLGAKGRREDRGQKQSGMRKRRTYATGNRVLLVFKVDVWRDALQAVGDAVGTSTGCQPQEPEMPFQGHRHTPEAFLDHSALLEISEGNIDRLVEKLTR